MFFIVTFGISVTIMNRIFDWNCIAILEIKKELHNTKPGPSCSNTQTHIKGSKKGAIYVTPHEPAQPKQLEYLEVDDEARWYFGSFEGLVGATRCEGLDFRQAGTFTSVLSVLLYVLFKTEALRTMCMLFSLPRWFKRQASQMSRSNFVS